MEAITSFTSVSFSSNEKTGNLELKIYLDSVRKLMKRDILDNSPLYVVCSINFIRIGRGRGKKE